MVKALIFFTAITLKGVFSFKSQTSKCAAGFINKVLQQFHKTKLSLMSSLYNISNRGVLGDLMQTPIFHAVKAVLEVSGSHLPFSRIRS